MVQQAPIETFEAGGRRRSVGWAVAWCLASGPLVVAILNTTHSAWTAMLAYHAGCVLLASRIGSWGVRPRRATLLMLGALMAVLVVAAGIALVPAVEAHLPMGRWRQWGLTPPGDAAVLAYFALVNPWVEEWFWRGGLVGPVTRGSLGMVRGAWISIAGFWFFHFMILGDAFGWLSGALVSLFVLLAGFAWTLLRLRAGNVWWGVATHLGANVGLAVVYFVKLRAAG